MPAISQSCASWTRPLCQISHAMLLAVPVGRKERGLVGQPVGQLLDMLNEPGERVTQ